MKAEENQQGRDATTGQSKSRRDETTDNAASPHATPGQAEGDRATVEESLRRKGLDDTGDDTKADES